MQIEFAFGPQIKADTLSLAPNQHEGLVKMQPQVKAIMHRVLSFPTDYGPSEEIPPPLSIDEVKSAESELGFALPPLLVEIYTQIGNGGIGPGFGILPLYEKRIGNSNSVLELRKALSHRFGWDSAIVPFCSWGCGVYSCIDLSSDSFEIYRFEPNIPQELTQQYLRGLPFRGPKLLPEELSLAQWLDEWLLGRGQSLFERMNLIM